MTYEGPWWTAGAAIAELWRLEGRGRDYAMQRLEELRASGFVDRLASEADRLLYERHPRLARELAVVCAALILLRSADYRPRG